MLFWLLTVARYRPVTIQKFWRPGLATDGGSSRQQKRQLVPYGVIASWATALRSKPQPLEGNQDICRSDNIIAKTRSLHQPSKNNFTDTRNLSFGPAPTSLFKFLHDPRDDDLPELCICLCKDFVYSRSTLRGRGY